MNYVTYKLNIYLNFPLKKKEKHLSYLSKKEKISFKGLFGKLF